MKVSYNIPFPSAQRNMGETLKTFYAFYDDAKSNTMCMEFDTKAEAEKGAACISSARYRMGLGVDIKRIENKVYVKKRKVSAVGREEV